jgi:indole-3-glycerol phosphate synthase
MLKTIPDILAQIVEHKKAELVQRVGGIARAAEDSIAYRRDFMRALSIRQPAIIAEVKKASPSGGVLLEDFDPVSLAQAYQQGGAAALSVLTDEKHFKGSLADLESARGSVTIPILRKDFTIDSYHVHQAAAHGADAILLIAAILTERQMREFRELAESYRMSALVEVHDEEELKQAIASGARIIGVNNRNLRTLEVRVETSMELIEEIPEECIAVCESGLRTHEDLLRFRAAGFDAFLIGEHLMAQPDPGMALRKILGT